MYSAWSTTHNAPVTNKKINQQKIRELIIYYFCRASPTCCAVADERWWSCRVDTCIRRLSLLPNRLLFIARNTYTYVVVQPLANKNLAIANRWRVSCAHYATFELTCEIFEPNLVHSLRNRQTVERNVSAAILSFEKRQYLPTGWNISTKFGGQMYHAIRTRSQVLW